MQNEILPNFKKGDFYAGIDSATYVMISLLDGKFTADEYRKQTSSGGGSIGGPDLYDHHPLPDLSGAGEEVPEWDAAIYPCGWRWECLSGGRHSGSFGNFSSGGAAADLEASPEAVAAPLEEAVQAEAGRDLLY